MSQLKLIETLRQFVKIIYTISLDFPKDEQYNLTSQIKRAAISISLNVREGNSFYDKRKISHFKTAMGSLYEVDECINLASELKYIKITDQYRETYWEVHNKLKKLIDSIDSGDSKSQL